LAILVPNPIWLLAFTPNQEGPLTQFTRFQVFRWKESSLELLNPSIIQSLMLMENPRLHEQVEDFQAIPQVPINLVAFKPDQVPKNTANMNNPHEMS
jgi:hypothetical protein